MSIYCQLRQVEGNKLTTDVMLCVFDRWPYDLRYSPLLAQGLSVSKVVLKKFRFNKSPERYASLILIVFIPFTLQQN